MKMAIVSLQYTEDIAAINYQPPPNSLIQISFEYKPIVYRLDLDETRQNIRFNFLFIKRLKYIDVLPVNTVNGMS